MRKHRNGSRLFAAAVALVIAAPIGTFATGAWAQDQAQSAGAPPNAQVPQPQQGGVNWSGVGYGAGSILTNVVYIPAKLVYALVGGLVGGGAWCLTGGNTQTADTVWRSSLGGDYVVTPDMLAGKEPIHFSGPTETPPTPVSSSGVQPINPPSASNGPPSATNGSASAANASPSGAGQGFAAAPTGGSAGGALDRGSGAIGGSGSPDTLPGASIE